MHDGLDKHWVKQYFDISQPYRVQVLYITQFFVHLILRIIENPLTRAFADDCQLHQLRRPGDVVWDAVRDGDDETPHPPRPVCLHSLLDDVVPYRW